MDALFLILVLWLLCCCIVGRYLECIRVVAREHAGRFACILGRFIDQLDHAHVAELVVLVDNLGHPLNPLQCAVVLEVLVEPGGVGVLQLTVNRVNLIQINWKLGVGYYLPRKRLLRLLRTRRTVQVHNDIHARITRPATNIL